MPLDAGWFKEMEERFPALTGEIRRLESDIRYPIEAEKHRFRDEDLNTADDVLRLLDEAVERIEEAHERVRDLPQE